MFVFQPIVPIPLVVRGEVPGGAPKGRIIFCLKKGIFTENISFSKKLFALPKHGRGIIS